MAENFPELLKIYSQVQESPNKVNERKPTSRHIVLTQHMTSFPTPFYGLVGLGSIVFCPVWLFIGNASDYISQTAQLRS